MEYGLVVLWLVLYLALLYVGMPIARACMPRLGDYGAGVALPAALALLWVVAYWVGQLSITAGLWGGLFVLGSVAFVLKIRGYEIDTESYARVATVFTIAFLFMLVIRVFDPSAHPGGGEKFLDMGLLQSLMRSSSLPPEDAWFAGETVRYYYGGHYISSLLARVTGTEARYAYNLALAGFFGMLVTGVYSVAGAIASSRGYSYRRAGLFGAFFVGFASNLHTSARLLLGVLPDSLALWVAEKAGIEVRGVSDSLADFSYWPASRIIDGTINEFPLFAWLNGDLHAHMMSTMVLVLLVAVLAQVFIAGSDSPRWRRLALMFGVVPALAGMIAVTSTWSFPTVGGLVVLTLALGRASPMELVSPALARWAQTRSPLAREGIRIGVAVAAAGIVLALGWLWSSPYWLFVASSTSTPGALPARSTIGGLLVVHGAFLVLFWLYLARHLKGVVTSTAHLVGLALLFVGYTVVADALGLGHRYLANLGAVSLFVPLILFGWILLRYDAVRGELFSSDTSTDRSVASDGGSFRDVPGFETVLIVAMAGLVVIVEFLYVSDTLAPERMNTVFKVYMQVWVLAAIAAGVVVARLLGPHTVSNWLSGRNWRRLFRAIVSVLVAATSLYGVLALINHLGLGAETTLLGIDLPEWVAIVFGLLVLAIVGKSLQNLAVTAGERLGLLGSAGESGAGGSGGGRRGLLRLAIALLVIFAGFYGTVAATSDDAPANNTQLSEPTLDSLRYIQIWHPGEAEAIEYLLTVEGQPNMLSDPNNGDSDDEGYTWGNAPASMTGVPTLAGWWPERGYRGHDVYANRIADIETMFVGEAAAQRQLLRQYDVELIYIGPNERAQYGSITVTELDAVSELRSWESVTIYRVDQSAL